VYPFTNTKYFLVTTLLAKVNQSIFLGFFPFGNAWHGARQSTASGVFDKHYPIPQKQETVNHTLK
jgi:hypothetical protein